MNDHIPTIRSWFKSIRAKIKQRKVKIELRKETVRPKNYWPAVAGIIGGTFGWWQWIEARNDHRIEILRLLDDRFNSKEVARGREVVDWDEDYDLIKFRMNEFATKPPSYWLAKSILRVALAKCIAEGEPLTPELVAFQIEERRNASLDPKIRDVENLLRFFEFLYVVHNEGQVQDIYLREFYSYYVKLYYNIDRRELRHYVDRYYGTLRDWLADDMGAPVDKRYFSPNPRMADPLLYLFKPRPHNQVFHDNHNPLLGH
jgi:hypothetical protein